MDENTENVDNVIEVDMLEILEPARAGAALATEIPKAIAALPAGAVLIDFYVGDQMAMHAVFSSPDHPPVWDNELGDHKVGKYVWDLERWVRIGWWTSP